jgi:hypothetical protein
MEKMPTIFIRGEVDRSLVTREKHPGCDWVFAGEGIARQKLDGTCCMVKNGELYRRFTVKNSRKEPDGFILCTYDETTGKKFGWVKCDRNNKNDRLHFKGYDSHSNLTDGTYELVGPKIQKNSENYRTQTLVNHKEATEIHADCPREFDELKAYLAKFDIEGIVFQHPDGRMAKIKKKDFGLSRSI